MKYYLTLDVGGTKIKGGVLNESGMLYRNKIMEFDAMSQKSEKVILNNFVQILEKLALSIEDENFSISGIGFAIPGPFDYLSGISLITGVGKYESIYKVNIKKEIIDLVNVSNILKECMEVDYKLIFLHDIQAFAIGESFYGKASQYKRVMYVCIGTGTGSAFTIDNRIIISPSDNVPQNGWIYNAKLKKSIIDDYISVRGLHDLCIKKFGRDIEGETLCLMAGENNENALIVFDEFGKNLLEALEKFLCVFKPECLVLGGQISKSYQYFGKYLSENCDQNNIKVFINTNTSVTAMQGIYNQLERQ
jgi:glucokinase